jgi:hypothetical protein
MQRAEGKEQRAKNIKLKAKRIALSFQQGSPERSRMGSPLQMRTKIIAIFLTFMLMFTACCAPATTSSTTLPETAFTATFLGFSDDGQSLLAKPEQSSENVQLIYDNAENLIVGQRVYVVGRLEGNLVHVNELHILL